LWSSCLLLAVILFLLGLKSVAIGMSEMHEKGK
jgi:hypothetical protein